MWVYLHLTADIHFRINTRCIFFLVNKSETILEKDWSIDELLN